MTEDYNFPPERFDSIAQPLLDKIHKLGMHLFEKKGRKLKVMEVCGTHTVAYARSGITELVSEYFDLRSGPGCPICVTHQADIDRIISLARKEDSLIVTFGDMLRVPGSNSTLEKELARGRRIEICYSPLDAVDVAARNPSAKVILIGIGFETTAPAIAAAIESAESAQLTNFWVYPVLKLVPPALRALLDLDKNLSMDGFLLPGHVATILGSKAFEFIPGYGLPAVVTGFEHLDLLTGLHDLMLLIAENKAAVGNAYSHVAKPEGNITAQRLMEHCYTVEATTLWRGLGEISASGYSLQSRYDSFNARLNFKTEAHDGTINPLCICGKVITGRATPRQCQLFGRDCTPSTPVGPCMVSPEGACGAHYHYM